MTDQPYSKRILELADKWLGGTITDTEKKEFADWYAQFDDRELLLAPEYEPVVQALGQEMLAGIRQRIAADTSPPALQPDAPLYKIGLRRLTAAAILIGVIATATFFFVSRNPPVRATQTADHTPPSKADILPGSDKAVLTLADGSNIVLDSAHTGRLARQGSTQVLKLADGRLGYKPAATHDASPVSYNILSTPRGGQYRLVLPDGSQVWLNAASSIRYPTAFTGTDRHVEITGEAYFEIAKNATMPFRVMTVNHLGDPNPMTIDVLGTQFNVNAYTDENAVRTTLQEGLVKVSKGKNTGLLKPGQQAQLPREGAIRWIDDVDVEEATAWKNGVFEFGDEELPAIMRQISRWYDVDVVYEGAVPTDRFTGRVSRNTSLSGVLKILKLSDIQLTISDNKIIVRS